MEIKMTLTKSIEAAREALRRTHGFINNGVSLGYIKMPTVPEDPAWFVLPSVDESLAALPSEPKSESEIVTIIQEKCDKFISGSNALEIIRALKSANVLYVKDE